MINIKHAGFAELVKRYNHGILDDDGKHVLFKLLASSCLRLVCTSTSEKITAENVLAEVDRFLGEEGCHEHIDLKPVEYPRYANVHKKLNAVLEALDDVAAEVAYSKQLNRLVQEAAQKLKSAKASVSERDILTTSLKTMRRACTSSEMIGKRHPEIKLNTFCVRDIEEYCEYFDTHGNFVKLGQSKLRCAPMERMYDGCFCRSDCPHYK